jgi:hypothetical protein
MKLGRARGMVLFLICVIGYIASYFLLMVRTLPAVDDRNEVAFKSAFRISQLQVSIINGSTVAYVRVSVFNYLYLPLDYLYHKSFPSSYKPGYEKHGFFKQKDWFVMR